MNTSMYLVHNFGAPHAVARVIVCVLLRTRTNSVGCGVSAGKIQANGDLQRRTCLIPTLLGRA